MTIFTKEWAMDDFNFPQAVGHVVASSVIVSTFLGWLPLIAAFFAVIWYLIQIWESKTAQNWRAALRHWNRNRIMRNRARKLAKLKAREKIVTAQIDALETVRVAKVEAREIVATAKADAEKLVLAETAQTAEKLPPL